MVLVVVVASLLRPL